MQPMGEYDRDGDVSGREEQINHGVIELMDTF